MNPAGRPVIAAPLPTKDVAVMIPVTLMLLAPLILTPPVKVAAVPVMMLSVDATPVSPSPDPTNDVAVMIPAPASIPVELMVTAVPTIALVDVVTPVTTAPVSYTHLRAH